MDRLDSSVGKPMAYFYIFVFTLVENVTAVTVKVKLHDVPAFQQVYFRGMCMILINYLALSKDPSIKHCEVLDRPTTALVLLRSYYSPSIAAPSA